MSRRALLYALLGILLFPALLAVTAPASWVGWGLHRLSAGRVQLDGASGYVWGGEGTLIVHPAHQPPFALGRFGWELELWPLLRGQVMARVHGGDGQSHLEGGIELARGELAVRDLLASFPAGLVAAFHAPAALLDPGGQLGVTAATLSLRDGLLEGQALLRWDGAATRFSPVRPLGDYRLSLEGQGESAALRLETAGGALALSGAGEWWPDSGELRFDGVASAAARAAELAPLLRSIGRDQGGGRRAFAFETRTAPVALPW